MANPCSDRSTKEMLFNMLKMPEKSASARSRSRLPTLSATTAASLLVFADSLAILISGYLTYDSIVVYSPAQDLYIAAVLFVWLVTLTVMNYASLYRFEVAVNPLRNLHGILVAVATAYLFLLAAAYSIKVSATFSRIWFVAFAASCVTSIALIRCGIGMAFVQLLGYDDACRSVAIIGEGSQSQRLRALLSERAGRPVRLVGVYTDIPLAMTGSELAEGDVLSDLAGDLGQLTVDARQGLIDDIVIALPWSEDDRIMNIVARLRELPLNVFLASDLIGLRTEFRSPPSHFASLPVVQVVGKPMSGWDSVIKTIEDYVLGVIILLLISPVLAIVALAVKLDSAGPVLFRQKRVGFNNEVFDVYKFRSMYHKDVPASRTVQATRDDPRITRVGRFIRRWSLDELPQIFNVFNGTMSIVGPRPHALDHNEEFAQRMEGYFARHRVKPGITGLAQVRGFRGPTDTEEKLEGRVRNDIFYAENWSLSLDLQILVRTLVVVLFGRNAY